MIEPPRTAALRLQTILDTPSTGILSFSKVLQSIQPSAHLIIFSRRSGDKNSNSKKAENKALGILLFDYGTVGGHVIRTSRLDVSVQVITAYHFPSIPGTCECLVWLTHGGDANRRIRQYQALPLMRFLLELLRTCVVHNRFLMIYGHSITCVPHLCASVYFTIDWA